MPEQEMVEVRHLPTTDNTSPTETDRAIDSRRYFPALDGLRAVSVLLVMLSHVRQKNTSAAATEGLFTRLHGALGVTVFFVLSGFLITLLALREEAKTGKLDFRAFYIRRAFRLFPLYYLVLALYVVLVFVVHADPRRPEFVRALPFYLSYLQEIPHFFFGQTAPFEISWSLGIEEKFYLVWPVIAFGLLSADTRRIWAAALAVIACFVVPPALVGTPNVVGMAADYGAIAAGCLVALIAFHRTTRALFGSLGRGAVAWLGVAAILVSRGNTIVVTVATCALLPALVTDTGRVAKVLGRPWLVWLGRRSYGFYLVHQLSLSIARRLLHAQQTSAGDIAVAACGLAITLAVIAVLYRAVEKPMIERGRGLSRRTMPDVLAVQPNA